MLISQLGKIVSASLEAVKIHSSYTWWKLGFPIIDYSFSSNYNFVGTQTYSKHLYHVP